MSPLTADKAERTRQGVARHCERATTTHDLLEGLSRRVRPVVDFDAAAWLTTDPRTVLFTDGYIQGFPPEVCSPWFHNELSVPDVLKYVDLASRPQPASTLYHETDGQVRRSHRWREVYRDSGFDDELRGVFRDQQGTWGVVGLAREVGRPRFTAEERDLVASLSATVAAGLRRITTRQAAGAPQPDGPGLLVIDPEGTVNPATAAGARWLDRIVPTQDDTHHRTALVALRELATGGTCAERHVPLRTHDGAWITLHASPMHHPPGAVAVIVGPSQPFDIAGVVSRAYGLSPRECEVAYALARGLGTDRIAASLHVSVHTVRDHLKSAFAKVGVSSRAELLRALFHRHYTDQLFERSVVHAG